VLIVHDHVAGAQRERVDLVAALGRKRRPSRPATRLPVRSGSVTIDAPGACRHDQPRCR
jgi:hypothetical protein